MLTEIKRDAGITIAKLMVALDKSRPTVTRAINELKEKGYIERVGSDKAGFWKVLR